MCVSPLVRFRTKKLEPLSLGTPSFFQVKSLKQLQSYFTSFQEFYQYFNEYMDYSFLPCRKCIECRISQSIDYSIRCYHESIMSDSASFITLTIDSSKAHLFTDNKGYMKTYCRSCVKGNRFFEYPIDYSLNKGFISDELKRMRDILRKRYGVNIRYFGCGEYGSNYDRPHYHFIIFNFNFPDKVFWSKSSKGVDIYISEELSSLWKYGISTVQDVNFNACMYTAKYVTKKIKSFDDLTMIDAYYGRQPEFLLFSKGSCSSTRCPFIDDIIKNCKGIKSLRDMRNPYCKYCKYNRGSLGYSWFLKYYKEIVPQGKIRIDGCDYPIPKYYIELLKLTDLEMYDKYKIKLYQKMDELYEKYPEYLSIEHRNVKKAIKKSRLKFSHRE